MFVGYRTTALPSLHAGAVAVTTTKRWFAAGIKCAFSFLIWLQGCFYIFNDN